MPENHSGRDYSVPVPFPSHLAGLDLYKTLAQLVILPVDWEITSITNDREDDTTVESFISVSLGQLSPSMISQKLNVLKNTPKGVPFPPPSQYSNLQSSEERMNFRKTSQLSFPIKNCVLANHLHINYRKMTENM